MIEDINGWGDHLCSACPIDVGLELLCVEVSILKRCHNNCATETKFFFFSESKHVLGSCYRVLNKICLYLNRVFIFCLNFSEVRCHVLPLIDHGMYSCTHGFVVDSRCDYTCYEGYQIEGDRYRMCQEEGKWSGAEPTCAGTVKSSIWIHLFI